MEEAFWSHRGVLTQVRLMVPVQDAGRFSAALGSTFDRMDFKQLEPPPEVDALFAKREHVVVTWREPGKVVVDLVTVVGDVPAARIMSQLALDGLRERNQRAGGQPGGSPCPSTGSSSI